MAKVDEGTEYTHCLSRLQQFSRSKATQPAHRGSNRRLARLNLCKALFWTQL